MDITIVLRTGKIEEAARVVHSRPARYVSPGVRPFAFRATSYPSSDSRPGAGSRRALGRCKTAQPSRLRRHLMTDKFWCLSQLFVRSDVAGEGLGSSSFETLMQAERTALCNRARFPSPTLASTVHYLTRPLSEGAAYRMVAPAGRRRHKIAAAGFDNHNNPIAPWPCLRWIGRNVAQELLRVPQTSASPISAPGRLAAARFCRDRACGPRRRFMLHPPLRSCRSAAIAPYADAICPHTACAVAGVLLKNRSRWIVPVTGGRRPMQTNGVGTRLFRNRRATSDGVAAFRHFGVNYLPRAPRVSCDRRRQSLWTDWRLPRNR